MSGWRPHRPAHVLDDQPLPHAGLRLQPERSAIEEAVEAGGKHHRFGPGAFHAARGHVAGVARHVRGTDEQHPVAADPQLDRRGRDRSPPLPVSRREAAEVGVARDRARGLDGEAAAFPRGGSAQDFGVQILADQIGGSGEQPTLGLRVGCCAHLLDLLGLGAPRPWRWLIKWPPRDLFLFSRIASTANPASLVLFLARFGFGAGCPARRWTTCARRAAWTQVTLVTPVPTRTPVRHYGKLSGRIREPPVRELPSGALAARNPAPGVRVLRSGMGRGYLGPEPIKGHGPHHYTFQLFALAAPAAGGGARGAGQTSGAAVLGLRPRFARGRLTGVYER